MNEILELEEKSRALEKKDNSQYCNKSLLEFQAVVKIKKCDIFGAADYWNLADKSSQTYAQKKVHQTENH